MKTIFLQLKADPIFFSGWLLCVFLFISLATLNINVAAQGVIITTLLLMIFLVVRYARHTRNASRYKLDSLRIIVLGTCVFILFRYLNFRITETINYHDILSLIAALLLLSAEIYSISSGLLGTLITIRPNLRKPLPIPEGIAVLPSVDILIPTYDEPIDVLKTTLLAAIQVRYPLDRINIYLLDDGGTQEKRQQLDPYLANKAYDRHANLQALCEEIGCHYLTRVNNIQAKAGNINEALKSVHGELILFLDADHIPTVDFLDNTVGFFIQDPKLFLVQTPHHFITPDPIEKNLDIYGSMPGENEMFYSVIQPGLDSWNSSFFCGSAALMRRSCIDEIGGISGDSITEDVETSLDLHGKGYRSVYLDKAMISGLQPDTFSSFVLQRLRWAQGMTQIFLLKNPLFKKGLNIPQRLAYTSSMIYWFFPYARIIFLLAPVAYLAFGLKIYDASLVEIFSYTAPAIIATLMMSEFIYGKVRWTFVSELYETLQSFFSIMGVSRTIKNPKSPSFKVTPKGEKIEQDYVTKLATPFYIMLAIISGAIVIGFSKYYYHPADRYITTITMLWAFVNLIIILGCLGVLLERKQRRQNPRNTLIKPVIVEIASDSEQFNTCSLIDRSARGAGIILAEDTPIHVSKGDKVKLKLWIPALKKEGIITGIVRTVFATKNGIKLGIEYTDTNIEAQKLAVASAYGDSQDIEEKRSRQKQGIGIRKGLIYLCLLSLRQSRKHFVHLWMMFFVGKRLDMAGSPCTLNIPSKDPINVKLLDISLSGAGLVIDTSITHPLAGLIEGMKCSLTFNDFADKNRIKLPLIIKRSTINPGSIQIGTEIHSPNLSTHKDIVRLLFQRLKSEQIIHRWPILRPLIYYAYYNLIFKLRMFSLFIKTPFTRKL